MKNVFDYLDYREFLKDFYKNQKLINESFSYAAMAQKTKISSRGLLKLIMDGKRNLSSSNLENVISGFSFNKSETNYFQTLVLFNQTKAYEEKNKLYEKLIKFPQRQRVYPLKIEQYNLYSKWYFSVIHELILLKECPQDLEHFCHWVTQQLKNKVSLKEAKEARDQLIALGLIKETPNGLSQANPYFKSNSKEEINFAIQNFHTQMISESTEAIKKPIEEREFGSVTLAFSKSDLAKAKEFIKDFKQKFNFELSAHYGADSVYQLNIQFFELADGSPLQADSVKNLNSANDLTKNADFLLNEKPLNNNLQEIL